MVIAASSQTLAGCLPWDLVPLIQQGLGHETRAPIPRGATDSDGGERTTCTSTQVIPLQSKGQGTKGVPCPRTLLPFVVFDSVSVHPSSSLSVSVPGFLHVLCLSLSPDSLIPLSGDKGCDC